MITIKEIANLIHEYNDACHMNVPQGTVCYRCNRIARQVFILVGVAITKAATDDINEAIEKKAKHVTPTV